jgi:hypothetical protein
MNKEDIIRMAREAELNAHGLVIDRLERFAKLVAAHEREQCLKLVDEQIHNMTVLDSYPEKSGAIYQAIINIRARKEK